MAPEAATVLLRCVTGADTDLRLVESDAGLAGHIGDAGERRAEVAFHVHGQGLQRAKVDDPASLGLGCRASQHEPVEAPEERGQRLTAAGRSQNEGVFAARDRRPA